MRRTLMPLVAVMALVGCDLGTTTAVEEFEWFGELTPAEGWEELSGQAAFAWVTGFTVFVTAAEISGDEPGAIRPWHLHHNTCAEGGGIVGLDADYPRLVVGADGTAGASATVPVPIDPTANYHVNVHRSEAEMETVILCGDMELIFSG